MKRVQVTYPLLHKRSINRQSPFLLHTCTHFYLSTIFSFLDESEEEGAIQPLSKEEEEVEVIRSWVEVGGFPAQPEEEAKGLLLEVGLSSCLQFSLPLSTFQLMLSFPLQSLHSISTLFFSFQGLTLLQRASLLQEEVQKLEERAQQLETEGWGKMKEAVAGSEAEGLYELLRGVTLHSHPLPSQTPLKKPHFAPSATIPSEVHRT